METNYVQCYLPSKLKVTMKVVTEWLVTDLLHYRHFCCYSIDCYIIGNFSELHYRGLFCYIIGQFCYIISCYIICKFGVTVSVDVTLCDVVTLSGVTGPSGRRIIT